MLKLINLCSTQIEAKHIIFMLNMLFEFNINIIDFDSNLIKPTINIYIMYLNTSNIVKKIQSAVYYLRIFGQAYNFVNFDPINLSQI